MARWVPRKRDVLDETAQDILHNYGHGRVLVAVDGADGSGAHAFADDLADALRRAGHTAFRASIDGFHRPRAERHARGAESPEGFYRDAYDYETLRRVLLQPFRMGGSTGFVTEDFDWRRDTQVEPRWITGPQDAILIIDGVFLNRPELRGLWNYSLWIDAPPTVAAERLLARDGEGSLSTRYSEAQAIYATESKPRTTATAIIDNTDSEAPRRVFADSC